MYDYVVIATSLKSSVESDIDKITSDINQKADRDLTNCIMTETFKRNLTNAGIIFVCESYDGDDGWYRIYSDNWCIQGGPIGYNTGGWVNYSVKLLKHYRDTKYRIIPVGNWSNAESSSCYISAKTVSGFTVKAAINNNTQSGYWEAKGWLK